MTSHDSVETACTELREAFASGLSATLAWRSEVLGQIIQMFTEHWEEAKACLALDMLRSADEADGELSVTVRELKDQQRNLSRWAAPERLATHLMFLPGSSEVRRSPHGTVLVIGPCNYPINLLMGPAGGAIAAGNVVLLKPSEATPACSDFLARRVPSYVDPRAMRVVEGGVELTHRLLELRWDFIFFTGSSRVGRLVAAAAARHMTPHVLELGGKSCVIVDSSTISLREAAKRIVNTKFVNAGQTCMAPDYVLCHETLHAELLAALLEELKAAYGEEPKLHQAGLARLCQGGHYERVVSLLERATGKVYQLGSEPPDPIERFVPPTVIATPDASSPLLTDEIFGPLLPVLPVASLAEAIEQSRRIDPTPLALYVFGSNEAAEEVMRRTQSGAVVVNDALVHNINRTLPFGGVGTSGHGVYHGRWSFETFSYPRAVLWRHGRWDIDQTVPLPLRHSDARYHGSPRFAVVRAKLIRLMLLWGPYVRLPRRPSWVTLALCIISAWLARCDYSALGALVSSYHTAITAALKR